MVRQYSRDCLLPQKQNPLPKKVSECVYCVVVVLCEYWRDVYNQAVLITGYCYYLSPLYYYTESVDNTLEDILQLYKSSFPIAEGTVFIVNELLCGM